MKIIHFLYSGMGGHGDVVFPKIQNDKENKNIIFFIGIENVFSNYITMCKKYKIKYYYFDYKNKINYFFSILKILNSIKPNIIFSHIESVFLLLIYKVFNPSVKLLTFQHISLKIKKTKNHFFNFFEYIFFDKIIFLSPSYKNKVLKKYRFLTLKKKSVVIPTGLKPLKVTLKKVNRQNILVGMSTRFVEGKKIFNLIKLIKYNYENYNLPLKMSIIGKGADYKKIKTYIKTLKLDKHISLDTIHNEKDLDIWNSNLSIYLHFSDGETLSTSIIRALRAGTPLIVSNTSGLKEMVGNKKKCNGYLVNDTNYNYILELINKLVKDKKLYNRLSKNSLNLFKKRYSLDYSSYKYRRLINFYR